MFVLSKIFTVNFNWRTLSIVDLDGDLCLESWVFTTFYNISPCLIIYLPQNDGNMLKMERLFTSNFKFYCMFVKPEHEVYRQKYWTLLHSDRNLHQFNNSLIARELWRGSVITNHDRTVLESDVLCRCVLLPCDWGSDLPDVNRPVFRMYSSFPIC